MSVETKVRGPRWTLTFVVLFGLFSYGAFTSGAITLGAGWAVLAISAWRQFEGQPSRSIWLLGVLIVLGYIIATLLAVRFP